MLHPADSSQWEMCLRIEKEPFITEHDILIHAVPGIHPILLGLLVE